MSAMIKAMRARKGASFLGYGLVVGLIAIVALVSVTDVGTRVVVMFTSVGQDLQNSAGATGPVDDTGPVITAVTASAGIYYAGYAGRDQIEITVTFDEPVVVTDGPPSLGILADQLPGPQNATMTASAGDTLTFTYTVVSNVHDYDGIDLSASISADGATIADAAGNPANLAFGAVTLSENVQIHFNPASISSSLMWMDADDAASIVTDTGGLQLWADKSQSNLFGQGNTTIQPDVVAAAQNGRSVLDFNRTSNGATGDFLLNNAGAVLTGGDATYTYVAVWKPDITNVTQTIMEQNTFSLQNHRRAALLLFSGGVYGFVGEGNDYAPASASAGSWIVTVMRVDKNAGSSAVRINSNGTTHTGTTNGGPTNLNVGTDRFDIGRKISTNIEYFDGQIAELMVYGDALSDQDVTSLRDYLTAKWGL